MTDAEKLRKLADWIPQYFGHGDTPPFPGLSTDDLRRIAEDLEKKEDHSRWIKSKDRLPVGVTYFETMSEWVAVKYFSKYDKKEITACGRYCHDRHEWFISGGCDEDANKKDVIKWLDEITDEFYKPVPSDEEIARRADIKYPDNLQQEAFRKGAKWMRDKMTK